MVEFALKVHPGQRVTWLPKELVEAWGFKLKLLPNQQAGVLYPEGARLEDVLRSLEILIEDIKLRIEVKSRLREVSDPQRVEGKPS